MPIFQFLSPNRLQPYGYSQQQQQQQQLNVTKLSTLQEQTSELNVVGANDPNSPMVSYKIVTFYWIKIKLISNPKYHTTRQVCVVHRV